MGRLRCSVFLRVTGRLWLSTRSVHMILRFGLTVARWRARLSNRRICFRFLVCWRKTIGRLRGRIRFRLLVVRLSVRPTIRLIRLRFRTCYGFRASNRRRCRRQSLNNVGKDNLVFRRSVCPLIVGRVVNLACGLIIIIVSRAVFCRLRLTILIRCLNFIRGLAFGRLVVLTVWRKRLIGSRWLANRFRWLNIRKCAWRRRT